MNERLTIQDLTDLLASKHSMTKKDAEAFVKEFFLLIEQALENEKTVKIKGLGTFKLIDVDSRESVNVNTGERFQIKGHTKVSFSPDASLRDTINKPFAHFETVVLNENTILEDTPIEESEEEETGEELSEPVMTDNGKKEGVQEEVSDAIIKEELAAKETLQEESPEEEATGQPAETVAEGPVEEVAGSESVSAEKTEAEQQPKEQAGTDTGIEETEGGQSGKQQADEIKAEKKTETEKEEIPPVTTGQLQPQQPAKGRITAEEIIERELLKANRKTEVSAPPRYKEMKTDKSAPVATGRGGKEKNPDGEKSPVPYLIAVIVIVLLLCGGVVLFIYYPDLFSSSSGKDTLDMPAATSQPIQPEMQLSDTIARKDTVAEVLPAAQKTVAGPVAENKEVVSPVKNENKTARQQSPVSAYSDSASYKITGTKTKYTIKEGETLTRVSLRFYGTKAMWPYIVKHNPKVIKNPNNVPYGTTIKIPELTKE